MQDYSTQILRRDKFPVPVLPGILLKVIPNFPFYLCGSDGSIWSCRTGGGGLMPWRKIAPYADGKGYLCVGLYEGKKLKRSPIHRIVLLTFIGDAPEGCECCHNDGDCKNNCLSNLRWDSKSENSRDTVKHNRCHWAKMTDGEVLDVRRRYKAGEPVKSIAASHRCGEGRICEIAIGKYYAWVGEIASPRKKLSRHASESEAELVNA